MIPHAAPPFNLTRREYSSSNSSAGPLIGAIVGIAIGIFILTLICIKLRSHLPPGPILTYERRSGGHDTSDPQLPNEHGRHASRVIYLPVPGPVLLRPTATPGRNDSGAFRFGPCIHPPGVRIDHSNCLVPVDPRWAQGRDPRRSRSEHRP